MSYPFAGLVMGILAQMRRSSSDFSDAFARIVEKHRKAKKLSRVALAELSGLHQTYIGLLERGLRSPNLETSKAIADALGIPLAEMIAQAEKLQK